MSRTTFTQAFFQFVRFTVVGVVANVVAVATDAVVRATLSLERQHRLLPGWSSAAACWASKYGPAMAAPSSRTILPIGHADRGDDRGNRLAGVAVASVYAIA